MYFWFFPPSQTNIQANIANPSLLQQTHPTYNNYSPFPVLHSPPNPTDHYFPPPTPLYQTLSIPNYQGVVLNHNDQDVSARNEGEGNRDSNSELQIENQAQNNRQIQKKSRARKHKKIIKNKAEQIPGRNRISNVFAAFFKFLLSPHNCRYAKKLSTQIISAKSLTMTPSYFIQKLKRKIVNFESYISKTQFFSIYQADGDFGIIFRIMFHDFLNTRGILHIITAKTRKKVLQQNKAYFMKALREIEQLFFPQEAVPIQPKITPQKLKREQEKI